jgi:hypothetical protein
MDGILSVGSGFADVAGLRFMTCGFFFLSFSFLVVIDAFPWVE